MVEQPIAVLNGVNGQAEVYANKIRIRRQGAMAKMTQGFFAGEKDLYFNQIATVQVKRAGMLTNGFIKFVVAGGVNVRKGLTAGTHDENTIMFRVGQQAAMAEWVRQYVEFRIAGGGGQPTEAASAPQAMSQPQPSPADQMRQLAELRDAGLVTPEEFEAKRLELLSRM
jgi:hypothetical protein